MCKAIKCDRTGCNREAVYTGHTYGHEQGETKDKFFPVNACEVHAKSKTFYVSGKIGETNSIQKYECLSCEEQFIVNESVSKKKKLKCPFCQSDAEAIAESGENGEEVADLLGCLMVRPSTKEGESIASNDTPK